MDFIKKHYEKVLLGAVLMFLTVAVFYMVIEIPREKGALKEKTSGIIRVSSKPLDSPDAARMKDAYDRLERKVTLNYSSGHNLFNPVTWQKQPNGSLLKVATGNEVGPAAVNVLRINPLYTTITYESSGASEGIYLVGIQRDAEAKSANRSKKSKYVSLNEKGEFFTLREVKGPPERPELTLELADTGERVKITADQPYQRVDGYTVDLEYKPENRKWSGKRVWDYLLPPFAGDLFTVVGINRVATNQFEVILSAKSTGKKTTIRFNAAQ